jgi:hypothetical protein
MAMRKGTLAEADLDGQATGNGLRGSCRTFVDAVRECGRLGDRSEK